MGLCSLWGTADFLYNLDYGQPPKMAVSWLWKLGAGFPLRRYVQIHMNLWWEKWHWVRYLSKYYDFILSVSYHQCSTLIFILKYSYTLSRKKSQHTLQPSKQYLWIRESDGQRTTITLSVIKALNFTKSSPSFLLKITWLICPSSRLTLYTEYYHSIMANTSVSYCLVLES